MLNAQLRTKDTRFCTYLHIFILTDRKTIEQITHPLMDFYYILLDHHFL